MIVRSSTAVFRPEPRSRPDVLEVATEALALDPGASLGAIASRAGIGRTTLHTRYATRQALLLAVADHALGRVEQAVERSTAPEPSGSEESARGSTPDARDSTPDARRSSLQARGSTSDARGSSLQARGSTPDDCAVGDALERLVRDLVPLGACLAYLFRHPELDGEAEVQARIGALEPPLAGLVRAGQRAGVLRVDLPPWWFVQTLYAQVYVAWEAVAAGRLARFDAPGLVLDTLVGGLGAPARGSEHGPDRGREGPSA